MGDAQPARPALPRMRNAALSIDTSQALSPGAGAGAQSTRRNPIKLDIRDVVRREGYRTDLNARTQAEEFRGNLREEQRMQRRDAFWSHVNKGVAYSWVSDNGLVVSDEEMELAFKYFRGGGIFWNILSLLFLPPPPVFFVILFIITLFFRINRYLTEKRRNRLVEWGSSVVQAQHCP